MKDLIVLVPCSQSEHSIRGILERPRRLSIRDIECDVFVHPHKDPGCLLEAHDFLRSQQKRYYRALVVFDCEGCGRETALAEELERDVEGHLSGAGWQDRAGCVVISPELEVWVWSDSPVVDQVCGWAGRAPGLRQWIAQNGYDIDSNGKPIRPKEALDDAIREAGVNRSSYLFREIAKSVSFRRCTDRAFLKLCRCLRTWFPVADQVTETGE